MTGEHILIVGAGPVGAAAALGLAQLGYSVTVVDRGAPTLSAGRLGVDIRNVALNSRSHDLLTGIGCWPAERAVPYKHMSVWEERGTACMEFHAEDLNSEALGWLVEMSPLTTTLWRALEQQVRFVEGSFVGLERDGELTIELDTGECLTCDVLIAADGAQSNIRSHLAIEVKEHPVNQHALATVVRTEKSHQATAWQRFLTDGPLALLPSIEETLVSIVWSGSKANVEHRMSLDDDAFCAALGAASEFRLGKILAVDERASFPLTQRYLPSSVVDDRIVFLGDAARVVHPMAGLGVNLGFEDVDALLAVARSASSLCRPGVWRKYVRGRRSRAEVMIRTLSALNQFYGTKDPWLGVIRNLGVDWLNRTAPVKHQIMREAMGIGPLAQS